MKKIFGLLACLFLLMGCDDGEMTFDTFNFNNTTPQLCDASTNTYIFINGTSKEVLVVRFPSSTFLNIVANTEPFTVSGLEYRVYEGATPTLSNVCGGIDNSALNVKERWTGSGTIDVVTTRVETETGVEFRHSITLVDVTFTKEGETIRILDNFLGELTTDTGYDFDFAENDSDTYINRFTPCNDGRYVFTDASEALITNIAAANLPNTVGDITIDLATAGSTNFISFLVYDSNSITSDIVCQGNTLSPTLLQRWSTLDAGQIIIHTIAVENTSPQQYAHLIYLKNAVFYNSLSNGESFTPEPNITSGTYQDSYYIGRIITTQ